MTEVTEVSGDQAGKYFSKMIRYLLLVIGSLMLEWVLLSCYSATALIPPFHHVCAVVAYVLAPIQVVYFAVYTVIFCWEYMRAERLKSGRRISRS